jgi:hypothetical protein
MDRIGPSPLRIYPFIFPIVYHCHSEQRNGLRLYFTGTIQYLSAEEDDYDSKALFGVRFENHDVRRSRKSPPGAPASGS